MQVQGDLRHLSCLLISLHIVGNVFELSEKARERGVVLLHVAWQVWKHDALAQDRQRGQYHIQSLQMM